MWILAVRLALLLPSTQLHWDMASNHPMHLSTATCRQVSAWLSITDGSNMFFALSIKVSNLMVFYCCKLLIIFLFHGLFISFISRRDHWVLLGTVSYIGCLIKWLLLTVNMNLQIWRTEGQYLVKWYPVNKVKIQESQYLLEIVPKIVLINKFKM
jgi:hypothetical protein